MASMHIEQPPAAQAAQLASERAGGHIPAQLASEPAGGHIPAQLITLVAGHVTARLCAGHDSVANIALS